MGADLCKGNQQGFGTSQVPLSDIYLSNPQNISRTHLQKSADLKLADSSNQFLGLSETSVILGCKQDQKRQLLNKYVLTYLYFLRNKGGDTTVQIRDFVKLLKTLDQQKKYSTQIDTLQSEYLKKSTPRQKAEFVINEYFKNGYFSSAIQKIPTYSFDPSIIGYARRPLIDLNKGIKTKYEKQPKKKQIYSVIQLTKDQQKLLIKMANAQDYFTFGTFIRCFSSMDKAKKRQKQLQKIGKNVRETLQINSSTLFFNIQIPNEQVDKDYDYGFYHDETQKDNPLGDIIMNILNFFQVTGAQPEQKTFDLKYNGLARLIQLKRARLLQSEPQLIKITTLVEGQCQQIKSHSSLLRLVTNRRLSITASQKLKDSVNITGPSEDNQRINLIQAYIEQKDFDKALKQCKDTLQFKVRKAQIYYEAKKYEQAQNILKETEHLKNQLKNDHFKEYILLEFISAKIKKIKGETKSAQKQLRSLSEAMKKEYRGSYEYRGREIQRELAECEGVKQSGVKWEEYSEGLNLGLMLSH